MKFKLIKEYKNARIGEMYVNNCKIKTPVFMPVGTYGNVKFVAPYELYNIGFNIMLSNSFHLMLNPGIKIINNHGKLHNFVGWKGLILTDSGGFQIFSLKNKILELNNLGFKFISPFNGKKIFFTPEDSVYIQNEMGVDIIMILDECISLKSSFNEIERSVYLSLEWARRCKNCFKRNNNALFGIIQGGMYISLRDISLNSLISMDFDGYAIGGLSVGESRKSMFRILNYITNKIPFNKPRYLMGVGTPSDIIESIFRGIDMFDCVIPTRHARNGWLYTSKGLIKIKNKIYENNLDVLDINCSCFACKNFTKSYLHYLNKTKEAFGIRLNTIHNLCFYYYLIDKLRKSIIFNKVDNFLDSFYNYYPKF